MSNLNNNTTQLEALLVKINALPEAGGDIKLPELTNEGAAADLLTGKQLIDGEGNIVIGNMATSGDVSATIDGISRKSVNIPAGHTEGGVIQLDNTIDNEVGVQGNLIGQITEAIKGKASGSYRLGYEDGRNSVIDPSKIITKTVDGTGIIGLTDVSEIPHSISVQLSGDNITDFSDIEATIVYGKNLLSLNREQGTVSSGSGNTMARPELDAMDKYFLSLSPNNYYNTSVRNFTITDDELNFDAYSASYGPAFPIRVIPNETYTISVDNITPGAGIGFGLYNKNMEQVSYTMSKNNKSATIVIPENVYIMNVIFDKTWENNLTYPIHITVKNPKVVLGSTIDVPFGESEVMKVNPSVDGYISGIIGNGKPVHIILNDNNVNISANYEKSYGRHQEWSDFWDAHQLSGTRTSYAAAFSYWRAATFNPKYDIVPTSMSYCFQQFAGDSVFDLSKKLEDLGVVLDTSKCTNFDYVFSVAYIYRIPKIDTTSCETLTNTFHYPSITTIDCLKIRDDGSTKFSNTFIGASKIKNITIEGVIGQNGFDLKAATLLSKESIINIINALSTTTSGLSIMLSKTAVNNAFETAPGLADGSSSSEWNTLIAPKNNWTINLS